MNHLTTCLKLGDKIIMYKKLNPLEYTQTIEKKLRQYKQYPPLFHHIFILHSILKKYLKTNENMVWGEFRVRLEKVLAILDKNIQANFNRSLIEGRRFLVEMVD